MIKRYISLFKSNPIVTALMSSLVIGYSICLLYIILIAKDSSLYEILQMIPSMLIFGALIGGFCGGYGYKVEERVLLLRSNGKRRLSSELS